MLRDKNLVPLSRQHQHALALCVRIDRALQAGEVADPTPWQAEIKQLWDQEVAVHFAAEETFVFPAAVRFDELRELVSELVDDHRKLREFVQHAADRQLNSDSLREFAQELSQHIRKEERQLFEALQKLLSADEFAQLGTELQSALASTAEACLLPSEATRLRPAGSK